MLEAEADLVEAETKLAGLRVGLVSEGLGGGAASEVLRKALHVPEELRGSQLEGHFPGLLEQVNAACKAHPGAGHRHASSGRSGRRRHRTGGGLRRCPR